MWGRGASQPLGYQSRDMNVFKGMWDGEGGLSEEGTDEEQIPMGRDIC